MIAKQEVERVSGSIIKIMGLNPRYFIF